MTQAAVLEKDWKAGARHELEALAKSGGTFNADTLRERGITEPDHPNQWGALFGAAHKRGLITKADYSSSQRKSRHGGFLHAWKGVPGAGA
jgi:hypothetical protein